MFLRRTALPFIAIFLATALCPATGVAQQTAGNTQTQDNSADTANKMLNTTRAFLTNKSTKPGITGELKEIGRDTVQGQIIVRYLAYIHGANPDQLFSAYAWPITKQNVSLVTEGASVTSEGVVVCAGRKKEQCGSPDKPDDGIVFAFPIAVAEPVRLAFVAADKSVTLMLGAVPRPLEMQDKGCAIEAIRLTPKWELVMVRSRGFKPNEPLQWTSDSAGEQLHNDGKADANGDFISAILPFVKGKNSGTTIVRITAAACSPRVSFEWGKL